MKKNLYFILLPILLLQISTNVMSMKRRADEAPNGLRETDCKRARFRASDVPDILIPSLTLNPVLSLQEICAGYIVKNIDQNELIEGLINGDSDTLKFVEQVCRTKEGQKSFIEVLLPNFKVFIGYAKEWSFTDLAVVNGPKIWRRVIDLNQVILVLILKYLKAQNRMEDFYKIVKLPHLNQQKGIINLVEAWSGFNPNEQGFLQDEFKLS